MDEELLCAIILAILTIEITGAEAQATAAARFSNNTASTFWASIFDEKVKTLRELKAKLEKELKP